MTPATTGDIDLLLELMAEYYACDGLRFDPALARTGLETLLNDESLGRAWLIREGGSVAGYLFLTFCFSLEFGGRFGLVDEIYLRPESRGGGLGGRALAYAGEVAAAMGFQALRLEVEHENIKARNLYQRIGFSAHERYLMTRWILPAPADGEQETGQE